MSIKLFRWFYVDPLRAEGKENDASDMESYGSKEVDSSSKNISIFLKVKKSLLPVLKLVGSDVARGLQPIHTLVPSICTAGLSSDGRGYSAPTAPPSSDIASESLSHGYDNQPGRDSHSFSFCCGHDL